MKTFVLHLHIIYSSIQYWGCIAENILNSEYGVLYNWEEILSYAIDKIQIVPKFVLLQLKHIHLKPVQFFKLNPSCTYALRKQFPSDTLDGIYLKKRKIEACQMLHHLFNSLNLE